MRTVSLRLAPGASRTGRRGAPTLALVSVLALAAAGPVAAPAGEDNLDAALVKHAPEVLRYLRDHGCRNVGILKFRIRKGNQPTSFKVGPLNDNLPGRLENALIAADPAQDPIGIVHDASRVAAARKLPRYDNPAGQRALFSVKYPLAWGDATVTPDLFLTGVVAVRADKKSATVTIEAFGPASPTQDKVLTFPVATDRALLADLNESFQIKARQLRRSTRNVNLDLDATEDAACDEAGTPGPAEFESPPVVNGAGGGADDPCPIDYEIRYSGKAQPVRPDPDNPGEFLVPEPREGQKVSIFLRTRAPERIGLVLMVNGKSTLYEEEGEPSHCKAWVLDPGREYEIHGFQQDNNTRKPFRVLSDEESATVAYSTNTGLIQFHLFKSGESLAQDDPGGGETGTDPDSKQPMNISLRGLNRAALVKSGQTRSLKGLQQAIRKHAPTKKTRGLIMPDAQAVDGKIQNDEVKNPIFIQSVVVRYYKPKGS